MAANGNELQLPEPSPADVLNRDRVVRELRQVFAASPEQGKLAAERLRRSLRVFMDRKNAAERAEALRVLGLLSKARRIALRRLSPKTSRSGLADRDIEYFAEWLQAAHTGRFGEWKAVSRVDLRRTSAIDAYVHARTVALRHGKAVKERRETVEVVRASLDPERAEHRCASPWWALVEEADALCSADPAQPRSDSQWWDVGLLCLLLLSPDFSPGSVGLDELPPWDSSEPGDHSYGLRKSVLIFATRRSAWGEERARAFQRAFRVQAERARDHLLSILPALVTPGPAGNGPIPSQAPRPNTQREREVVQALREKKHRLSGPDLAEAAWGKRTVHKTLFANMVRLGILTQATDRWGKGYGLPEWTSQV